MLEYDSVPAKIFQFNFGGINCLKFRRKISVRFSKKKIYILYNEI